MPDSVYKVIEVIGSSPTSWEDAAKKAVEKVASHLEDVRVAEDRRARHEDRRQQGRGLPRAAQGLVQVPRGPEGLMRDGRMLTQSPPVTKRRGARRTPSAAPLAFSEAIAPPSQASVAATLSSTLPLRACEIGQPSLAASAAAAKPSASRPGTTPVTSSDDFVTANPASVCENVTVAETRNSSGGVPGLGQTVGEAHREAAGVGGGHELLGTRLAGRALGPRRPGHRQPRSHAAVQIERAASRRERSLPDDIGTTSRRSSTSCSSLWKWRRLACPGRRSSRAGG